MISFKYEKIDFTLSDGVKEIRVKRPDGRVDRVSPFKYLPVRFDYDLEGNEMMFRGGEESLRCRYTPDFEGEAEIEILSDTVKSEKLTVLPSPNHGYIGVSKKNKKYFAYSDGAPYFAVGINLCFPTQYTKSDGVEFGLSSTRSYLGLHQYERWFRKCAENGVNLARIWLGHEYFCPDTENTYEFDYMQFSKIDALIELAKKYKIKLKLTLEQFRYFDYDRVADGNSYSDDVFGKFNKRLYDGGDRCESAKEWFTCERWQKAWLAKVSEFSKRYAGETQIFAIELWNEANACSAPNEDILAWNKLMLPRVRELFPNHMVTSSLGSLGSPEEKSVYDEFFSELDFDFVQIHRYLDMGAAYDDCKLRPTSVIRGAFELIKSEKPMIIAETGAVSPCHSGPFRYYANDDRGILFADLVYPAVFMESAGVGNIWHWDERYVEFKNLYHMYRPIADMINDVNFESENFVPLELSDKDVTVFLLRGETVTLGYIRNRDDSWQTTLRDDKETAPVDSFEFEERGARSIVLYRIWDDDRVRASIDNDVVKIRDIDYGTLFRIEK